MFTRSPSRLHIRAVDTRLLDDHAAVLVTIAGSGDESHLRYDKLQTLVLVRAEDDWRIAALHNTAMSDRSTNRYRSR